MPIGAVVLNDSNPRFIKDEAFSMLVKSLKDCPSLFQARPLLCSDRTGEYVILGGNMRYRAAVELGYEIVPVIVFSDLSEEGEREIIIKDNGSFGSWDMDELANSWSNLPLNEWGIDLPKNWLEVEEESKDEEPALGHSVRMTIEFEDLEEFTLAKYEIQTLLKKRYPSAVLKDDK